MSQFASSIALLTLATSFGAGAQAQTDTDLTPPPPPPPPPAAANVAPALNPAVGSVATALPQTTVPVFAVTPHASNKISGYPLSPRFIVRDSGLQRLFVGGVASGRGGGLICISLDSGAIKPLQVGDSAALAVDVEDNKIFVALANLPQIDVLDRKSLQRIDRITLNDPAATLSYDTQNHVLIAGAARQAVAWLIDARQHVLVDSVVLSGIGAAAVLDDAAHRDYIAVQAKDSIDVVDPISHAVAALWQLAPSFSPQSIAVIPSLREALVAGTRGTLSVVSLDGGKIIGSTSVPAGLGIVVGDGVTARLVFVSSATGAAGVFSALPNAIPAFAGSFAVPQGASAAISFTGRDGSTDLYVAYQSGAETDLQRFTLPPP